MKRILKILAVIVFVGVISKVFGYIQQDHLVCPIVDINGNTVTVEAYGGNLYDFESKTQYEIGEEVKVDFFDFEDYDATNNVIVKISKLN